MKITYAKWKQTRLKLKQLTDELFRRDQIIHNLEAKVAELYASNHQILQSRADLVKALGKIAYAAAIAANGHNSWGR